MALTLKVAFQNSFAGNRGIWLSTLSKGGGNSGWQALGTWSGTLASGPPAAPGCTAVVTGTSIISFDPATNTVTTDSATGLNYCAWLYYDAYVESFVYGEGNPDPLAGAYALDPVFAEVPGVSTSSPNGYDYSLRSDHYVVAYQTTGFYTSSGSPIYVDPLGFLPAGPTSGSTSVGQPFEPTYIPLFVTANYVFLGSTSVSISTSDQPPIIETITPPFGDIGTSTSVTITGKNFGINPTLQFSGSGISAAINSSSDTQISATFTVDANANTGDQVVSVLSRGASGLAFRPAVGKSPSSNPKTFRVRGSTCDVTIVSGTRYSLGSDYLTVDIPLRAESTCAGTVNWTLKFVYFTTSGLSYSTSGPFSQSDVLRQPGASGSVSFVTPRGSGGRVDVIADVTINNQTTRQAVTYYVDGITIPPVTISSLLVDLYSQVSNKPDRTPGLLAAISGFESGKRQFGHFGQPFGLFGISGMWPFESYDGGSHVGVMPGYDKYDKRLRLGAKCNEWRFPVLE